MTKDQYSAYTTTGEAIRLMLERIQRQWEDGCCTDAEFLALVAGWFNHATQALENPVE